MNLSWYLQAVKKECPQLPAVSKEWVNQCYQQKCQVSTAMEPPSDAPYDWVLQQSQWCTLKQAQVALSSAEGSRICKDLVLVIME
jgi:hypothetical protein